MNKIVVMTALAAGLLVSAAAIAAPRAVAPSGAVTLVRAGGGGNGHFGNIGAATDGSGGAHFEPKGHLENYPVGQANPEGWRNHRFYPGGLFVYGGDYGSVSAGACGWLRREAQTTGSHYWWRRYEECLSG